MSKKLRALFGGFFPEHKRKVIEHRVIKPDIAAELIVHAEPFLNRRLNPRRVDMLVRAILSGDWNDNGETMKFDGRGVCFDGQHRLKACVKSGKAISTFCMFNGDIASVVTIDTGLPRSFADYLRMKGVKNSNTVQSVVFLTIRYEQDLITRNAAVSVTELLSRYEQDEEKFNQCAKSASCLKVPGVSGTQYGFLQYQIGDSEKFDDFSKELLNGSSGRDNPVHRLQVRMANSLRTGQNLASIVKLAMMIKAWNAYNAGQELRTLAWKRFGPKSEDFPVISKPTE